MENYTIKKSSAVNVNELKSFYKNAYFSRGSIFYENFNWFYKTNFSNETPLVICLGDKVIGHAGILTDNLTLNGNIYKFTWLTDLIILSKYRNLGLANKLVSEWMNICENKITFPNDTALKIYKKFEWKTSSGIIRVVNTTFLDKVFLKKFIFKNKIKKLKVNKIDKNVIKDILEVENINNSSEVLKIVRDESWFNWRFIECPFLKNILCFQYDDQFVVAQIFEGKNKWRMNILYSSEIILEESKIFQAIKLWASDKGINFLWHISNLKNTRKNIFSKLLKKTMNFAYYTSNKELIMD